MARWSHPASPPRWPWSSGRGNPFVLWQTLSGPRRLQGARTSMYLHFIPQRSWWGIFCLRCLRPFSGWGILRRGGLDQRWKNLGRYWYPWLPSPCLSPHRTRGGHHEAGLWTGGGYQWWHPWTSVASPKDWSPGYLFPPWGPKPGWSTLIPAEYPRCYTYIGLFPQAAPTFQVWGGRGVSSLSQIGLADPHLETLCAETGVAACLMGEEASDRYLHLRLWWDIIINLKRVNVGGQWTTRGVRVFLMVEGVLFLVEISHVGPGKVGRPSRHVMVPAF